MSHESRSNNTHTLVTLTRQFGIIACLGMLAGVLIWAKLRLVTDIPRSAYAEPRELDNPTEDQADPTDPMQDQSTNLVDTGAGELAKEQVDSSDSTPESPEESGIDSKP